VAGRNLPVNVYHSKEGEKRKNASPHPSDPDRGRGHKKKISPRILSIMEKKEKRKGIPKKILKLMRKKDF